MSIWGWFIFFFVICASEKRMQALQCVHSSHVTSEGSFAVGIPAITDRQTNKQTNKQMCKYFCKQSAPLVPPRSSSRDSQPPTFLPLSRACHTRTAAPNLPPQNALLTRHRVRDCSGETPKTGPPAAHPTPAAGDIAFANIASADPPRPPAEVPKADNSMPGLDKYAAPSDVKPNIMPAALPAGPPAPPAPLAPIRKSSGILGLQQQDDAPTAPPQFPGPNGPIHTDYTPPAIESVSLAHQAICSCSEAVGARYTSEPVSNVDLSVPRIAALVGPRQTFAHAISTCLSPALPPCSEPVSNTDLSVPRIAALPRTCTQCSRIRRLSESRGGCRASPSEWRKVVSRQRSLLPIPNDESRHALE